MELEPYRLLTRGRAGVLAVRRLRRPGGALAAHGTRGADPHGHRRDPRLAGAERLARQRPRRPRAQAGDLLPHLLPRHLLRGQRSRARREAGPDAPAADRGRGAARAGVAVRVAHRHEPLQRDAPHLPVPSLRGLRRAHRARKRLPCARVGPAPDRARRRARDADPDHRLPPSPRRPARLAGLRWAAHARRARHRARARPRSC